MIFCSVWDWFWGLYQKSFFTLVHALVSEVFNFKAFKHKGSQRITQRAQRKKSITI